MKLNVVKLRFAWFLISGLTIGLSIVALAMWGLREGIEFTGGSLLALRFEHRPSAAELQSALDASKIELGSVVIQPVGDTDVQVRLKNLDEDQHQQVTKTVKEKFADATELRSARAWPGRDRRRDGAEPGCVPAELLEPRHP
jgi:preprotein translocase subunit SecF